MNKQLVLLAAVFTALVILTSGCSSQTAPEKIYWQYFEACSQGNFSAAEEHLTENAKNAARTLGTCAFAHDAINTVEAANGNPPRTFSEDPTVNTIENRSSISWFDDQGNVAIVFLVMVDDSWKISDTTWSR
jgi:hypothetical protein